MDVSAMIRLIPQADLQGKGLPLPPYSICSHKYAFVGVGILDDPCCDTPFAEPIEPLGCFDPLHQKPDPIFHKRAKCFT